MHIAHPHICLFQPEIPQNTGNIGRLAAATQCRLHLIKPFGFTTDDKNLRRAGLDYWPYLDLEIHEDFDHLLEQFQSPKMAFLSKSADKSYIDIPPDTELLVFGRETTGLPTFFRKKFSDSFYSIPIYHPQVRSLNLANAVSIVVYSQLAKVMRSV